MEAGGRPVHPLGPLALPLAAGHQPWTQRSSQGVQQAPMTKSAPQAQGNSCTAMLEAGPSSNCHTTPLVMGCRLTFSENAAELPSTGNNTTESIKTYVT